MPEFSVKKPLTIFCCAIAILVLGIVAYTRMTPDLLPSMDFPYVIIMTTDPGASPETVEEVISKPMERSMATLDNIKNVSSTSSDNYSVVTLEFEDDANLDSIGVDIQQKISTLQPDWPDTVGTPYVLKINPSLLPVLVAGVSMEGMEITQLSEFVDDTLMPQLEGITGVARVTTSGSIEQELHILISQEKIDALNETIAQGINDQMDAAVAKLNAAKAQLTSALRNIQMPTVSAPQEPAETSEEAQAQIEARKQQMEESQETIQGAIDSLQTIRRALNDPSPAPAKTPEQQARKAELEQEIASLDRQIAPYESRLQAIQDGSGTQVDKLRQMREIIQDETYRQLVSDQAAARMELTSLEADLDNATQESVSQLLPEGLTVSEVDNAVTQLINTLTMVQNGMEDLSALQTQMEENNISLEQVNQMYQQITSGSDDLNNALGGLVEGVMGMSTAMVQIENGLSTIENSRDTALQQADLNNLLTLQMVSQILAAQNFSMPAGYVEQEGVNYMVSVGDEFSTQTQLENLLLFDLGVEGVEPIYLKDVADVFITDNSATTYTRLGTEDGLMLRFEKQSNCATATASKNIMKRFASLEAEYNGLKFVSLMDQGDYIYLIVNSILQSLLYGMLFSVLVLFFFLKDLRPTFITLCAMPLSVLFAVVLMYFSGISLNMISLSGLSIAVGMLVDNSVVVIENVYRLRAKGATVIQAAVSGAKQVSGAIIASTLTTICVFLPIVFVEGLTRQLFTDLALTMSYALIASLIVALTLVPAMAVGMLKTTGKPKKDVMENVYDKYRFAGRWALDHKPMVFGAAVVMLALSAALCLSRGFSFMPDIDSNTISGTIEFPEETELAEVIEISDQAVARIAKLDGMENVGATLSSSSLLNSGAGDNSVSLYVTLPEGTSGKSLIGQITALCGDLPCELSLSSSMMDVSMLTGSGTSVVLSGNDMDDLQKAAGQVAEMLERIDGTVDVSDGLEDAAKALHVNIDRNKAMEHGYTVAQIYMQLAGDMTQSATATSFYLDGAAIDVVVETPTETHVTAENLADQVFTQENPLTGETTEFTLSDIATIEETISLNTISRNNQQRYLNVTANTAEGYNVTKVANNIEYGMKSLKLPDSVTWSMSGETETIMEAMKQLVLMLLLGLMLVYFVMVAQFQSLKSPFIVMFTIPLAFTGGFLGLLLTGMEVSIVSMIGFVMLMGIIVNNGIVLVDYVNQLRLEGWERQEAIIEAGCTRIRPILMTSLTTILGLAVMAMGRDAGTALMQPMAVVCIGGLLYATLMTLFVVPCIYDLMNKKELRKISEEDLIILTD